MRWLTVNPQGSVEEQQDSRGNARFRHALHRLPPVSFLQLPMVSPVDPFVRNPALVLLRRTVPAAGGPDVVVAFIAVVPRDPHVSPLRGRTTALVNRRRRSDANHNLRK